MKYAHFFALFLASVFFAYAAGTVKAHEFKPRLECSMLNTWEPTGQSYRREKVGEQWWQYFKASKCTYGVARVRKRHDKAEFLKSEITAQEVRCRAPARNEHESAEIPCEIQCCTGMTHKPVP